MLVEVALVCKRGSTARHLALIGLFPSMQPEVGFQDAFLIERTAAAREWALEVALTQMCLLMDLEPLNFTVGLVASFEATFVPPCLPVDLLMDL